MNKKLGPLLATALAGTMAITAITPVAYAQDSGVQLTSERGERHDRMESRGGPRGGAGGLLRLTCSDNGAPQLELALNRVAERVDLTEEQQPLFDALKTTALTVQTSFADNCVVPAREDNPDMIEMLKLRQTNMAARITAMEEVLPSLEVFYDSLTDTQKAQLHPKGRDQKFGERDDRRGPHMDHDFDQDDMHGRGLRKGQGPRHS